jgi:hypothetical protein
LFAAIFGAAIADLAIRPLKGPADAPIVPAATSALLRRNVRRSMVLIGSSPVESRVGRSYPRPFPESIEEAGKVV